MTATYRRPQPLFRVIFRVHGLDVFEFEMHATSYRWAQRKCLTRASWYVGFRLTDADVTFCAA